MMARFKRLVAGFIALLRKRRVEEELDAELRAYFEIVVETRMRAAMTRGEATRAARIEMGSPEAIKPRTRDAGWEAAVESVWRDVSYALRMLRRSPGFACAAILTLAVGIGATTAMFTLLDAVILRSLPVRNPRELVLVRASLYPAFQAFRQHTNIFVDLFATSGVTPLEIEIQNGVRERTNVSLVSGSYFSTLGVQAAIGRVFTVNDDRVPGEHPVAVASYRYFQRRFGEDAAILNRKVRISGTPVTIIGVAPPGFFGERVGEAPALWIPLTMWGHVVPGRNLLRSPGTGWLEIVGRMRPGVTPSTAQAELTAAFRHVLTDVHGARAPDDVRREIASATVTLEPADKGLSGLRTTFARPLWLLMGAVILVLLIACANIASLLLARATARRREIEVRLALGVSRARLVRQLLTESVVLAAVGGALGVALASIGRDALLRLISIDGSRLTVATDVRLLAFVAATSAATAILFGFAPAWHSARGTIGTSLVVRGGVSSRQRFQSALVASQVAVSLVLLMGGGLLLRTIANLRHVDLGFLPERLLIVDVNPQAAGYVGDRSIAVTRRLLEMIASRSGVTSASVSENAVLLGRDSTTNLMRPDGFVTGPEGYPRTHWDVVGPAYFSTMGIRLLSGRDFSDQDDVRSPPVVAINEQMERLFFATANPIGRRLWWGVEGEQKKLDIVAVVRDVKQSGPRDEPEARFYLPYFQMPAIRPDWIVASTRFAIRTATDPATLIPVLRQTISSADPRLSIDNFDLAPDLVNRTLVQERMVATLLVIFSIIAVGLACLGLYGLIAYQVARRTSEIGIRMALGAQRRNVLWTTLWPALVWIAAGIAVGIPLALAASRAARSLLFGLSATDAATLASAATVMCAMGLIAGYLPARRASRIDPLVALRWE